MHTLKKRADFSRLNQLKQTWVTPGFILQAAQTTEPAEQPFARCFRVGFTASRKVGNAVKRNLAKRRLRVLVSQTLRPLALPGHDYVLVARQPITTLPFEQLKHDMQKAVRLLHSKYQLT